MDSIKNNYIPLTVESLKQLLTKYDDRDRESKQLEAAKIQGLDFERETFSISHKNGRNRLDNNVRLTTLVSLLALNLVCNSNGVIRYGSYFQLYNHASAALTKRIGEGMPIQFEQFYNECQYLAAHGLISEKEHPFNTKKKTITLNFFENPETGKILHYIKVPTCLLKKDVLSKYGKNGLVLALIVLYKNGDKKEAIIRRSFEGEMYPNLLEAPLQALLRKKQNHPCREIVDVLFTTALDTNGNTLLVKPDGKSVYKRDGKRYVEVRMQLNSNFVWPNNAVTPVRETFKVKQTYPHLRRFIMNYSELKGFGELSSFTEFNDLVDLFKGISRHEIRLVIDKFAEEWRKARERTNYKVNKLAYIIEGAKFFVTRKKFYTYRDILEKTGVSNYIFKNEQSEKIKDEAIQNVLTSLSQKNHQLLLKPKLFKSVCERALPQIQKLMSFNNRKLEDYCFVKEWNSRLAQSLRKQAHLYGVDLQVYAAWEKDAFITINRGGSETEIVSSLILKILDYSKETGSRPIGQVFSVVDVLTETYYSLT
jgi:hypothetical protein